MIIIITFVLTFNFNFQVEVLLAVVSTLAILNLLDIQTVFCLHQ